MNISENKNFKECSLAVSKAQKFFGNNEVLKQVDLTISSGEFVTLLGPSGCGKSTLLRIIAGIETMSSGKVELGGQVVSDSETGLMVAPENRNLGMVFQSYAVWPHMTVFKNVEFPLRYRKVERKEREKLVADALNAVDMGALGDRFPHQLSGGQQQRVALARAIVGRPPILLLDEPLSNLDARLRENMRIELKRLHHELGLTMLYVTHDQSEALAMSDRILVMDNGEVLQEGSPESVYNVPVSLEVAKFLGRRNILELPISDSDHVVLGSELIEVEHSNPLIVGDNTTVCIKPNGFKPSQDRGFSGVISLVEFLGGFYEHEIKVGESNLIVQHQERLGERGQAIRLQVDRGAATAFSSEKVGVTKG